MPAAGTSSRMKQYGNKLFMEVGNTPVILLTLRALENSPFIDEIIIPTREDMIDEIKKLCADNSITKVKKVICGGSTRTESVLNGVLASKGRFDLIAIHDAARPFVSAGIIENTVTAAANYGAAAPAIPIKDTVKEAEGGIIRKTVPRESLFGVQTPQIFDSDLITAALVKAQRDGLSITDDCSAAEAIGTKVFLTEGDYFNIKITTPEDLIFANAIYSELNRR